MYSAPRPLGSVCARMAQAAFWLSFGESGSAAYTASWNSVKHCRYSRAKRRPSAVRWIASYFSCVTYPFCTKRLTMVCTLGFVMFNRSAMSLLFTPVLSLLSSKSASRYRTFEAEIFSPLFVMEHPHIEWGGAVYSSAPPRVGSMAVAGAAHWAAPAAAPAGGLALLLVLSQDRDHADHDAQQYRAHKQRA